jgi:hypothetical protein
MENRRKVIHTDTYTETYQRIELLIKKHCPRLMRLGGYISEELEQRLERKKDIYKINYPKKVKK